MCAHKKNLLKGPVFYDVISLLPLHVNGMRKGKVLLFLHKGSFTDVTWRI